MDCRTDRWDQDLVVGVLGWEGYGAFFGGVAWGWLGGGRLRGRCLWVPWRPIVGWACGPVWWQGGGW
ncbi:hypothetical protein SHKM778_23490 [Streptomyces sp. KM77-8]|uniref:Uncharacterized protein n=1 Tax=Streptomyces haneummycinicus TaxID=3074435 RepID=A0AAT9HF86_9ACTN